MFVIMFYNVFICFSCFCFMFLMSYSKLLVRELCSMGYPELPFGILKIQGIGYQTLGVLANTANI